MEVTWSVEMGISSRIPGSWGIEVGSWALGLGGFGFVLGSYLSSIQTTKG